MGMVHWIDAEGGERRETSDIMPPHEDMEAFVGGDIEFVWVLFKGRRTCMIVNETGAKETDERGPLPINMVASKIYAAASRRMSDLPRGYIPRIHGNVVVLENICVL